MNEATQFEAPSTPSRLWVALKRMLVGIVILIATVGFLANAAGVVGVWIARRAARDTVTALSTLVNSKLKIVDQALARVSARADKGRQALARVNDAASKLGDRLEDDSPLLIALANAAGDDLSAKIAETRAQAVALHDAAVSVNATLEMLDSLGFINVPTFADKLGAVSEQVASAQSDVQELRAAIDEAKTATSANLVAAVTTRTIKIDNKLAQIKSTAIKYQATVAQKQQRVTGFTQTLLRAINLLVLSLTALFLVVGTGQVLLIYVCWQYARSGRFCASPE
jgi:predicted  nucleic acid-binding Zn-ribbon protein